MSKPAVKVTGLSKKFNKGLSHKSLKDIVKKGPAAHDNNEFWALKDISFEIMPGQTFGIVGGNGAGKSTLLKILSGVLYPTTGSFEISGSVSSLLEVGTGFHPELTGLDNVYFNGSLLGLSKKEIRSKLDEIIEFSEVGEFINTPLKYYSSGMRVKLGFSVSAFLNPDVMIIDEALSVGDFKFQQKSMKKMKETVTSGRTVIFVTHNTTAIANMCQNAIWLDNGKIKSIGPAKSVVDDYIGKSSGVDNLSWEPTKKQRASTADGSTRITCMKLLRNGKLPRTNKFKYEDKVQIVVEGVHGGDPSISAGVALFAENRAKISRSSPNDYSITPNGKFSFTVSVPTEILKPGYYYFSPDIDILGGAWSVNPHVSDVRIGFFLGGKKESPLIWSPEREGLIKPCFEWNAE